MKRRHGGNDEDTASQAESNVEIATTCGSGQHLGVQPAQTVAHGEIVDSGEKCPQGDSQHFSSFIASATPEIQDIEHIGGKYKGPKEPAAL